MLFELEQECLEVYRRKVDQANKRRAQLRQAIADSEAELAAICSSMGERPVHIRQVWLLETSKPNYYLTVYRCVNFYFLLGSYLIPPCLYVKKNIETLLA